jgi:hypothetical protein
MARTQSRFRNKLASAALGVLALGAIVGTTAGCVVQASPPATHTGFLTVQWSIAGTFSAHACTDFAVTDVQVVAFDSHGAVAGQQTVACESHSAELELFPDTYGADVTMLDSRGAARSTTLHLPPTYVYSDTNVTLDTDFPSNSFY